MLPHHFPTAGKTSSRRNVTSTIEAMLGNYIVISAKSRNLVAVDLENLLVYSLIMKLSIFLQTFLNSIFLHSENDDSCWPNFT